MKPKYPDGFLEMNLANSLARTHCEGGCASHSGGIRAVRVIDPNGAEKYDWGYFSYCEEAMAEDKRRGMTILVEGNEGFAPEA